LNWYSLLKFAGIKLLHGTSSSFNQFDLSFAGQRDWGDYGVGVYLTPSDYMAKEYAAEAVKSRGGKPVVYLVEANVSSLANMDDPGLLSDVSKNTDAPFPKKLETGQKQSRPEQESRNITEFLIQLGYDGARHGKEYIIFDPAKINILKSFDLTSNINDVPSWLSEV